MEQIKIDGLDLEKIDSQFEVWANFLNLGLGITSFTFALASLGTESPVFNSILSLVVVLILRIRGKEYFPTEYSRLRDLAQKNPQAKIAFDGLQKKYFGFASNFTRYHLFMFGLVFLLLIPLSHQIAKFFPWWGTYVGV